MSKEFNLPQEVVDQVKTLFESPGRISSALDMLRTLDREPGKVVLRDMGAPYGIESSTMYQIKAKLSEAGLWTSEFGSVPLYRAREKGLVASSTNPAASPRRARGSGKQTSEKNAAPEAETEKKDEEDDGGGEAEEGTDGGDDASAEFDSRLSRMEDTLENLSILVKSTQAGMVRMVKDRNTLTVKKPKANPEAMEGEEPEEEAPAKGYDNEGEDYVEPEYPRGTLRDQASNPNTLRKIVIQFTPFSLMGFDYAVQNGFEGTESDFVNLTIESYFTSRGIELQWIKRTRIQAAPPQGRLKL